MQGAIAAGLLGGGSRFRGVTEDTGRHPNSIVAQLDSTQGWGDEQWDEVALSAAEASRARFETIPELGHPGHKDGNPRTPVVFAIAQESGQYGAHLALFEAIGRVHEGVLGRRFPLNGAGVGIGGAALAGAGLPIDLLRGFALLARSAGLIGHLAEENELPIVSAVYAEVDRHARYVPRRWSKPSEVPVGLADWDLREAGQIAQSAPPSMTMGWPVM